MVVQRADAIDKGSSKRYCSFMNSNGEFASFFTSLTPEEKRELAEKADTSVAYLSQIANGHRQAGGKTIVNLLQADSRITIEMLRGDMRQQVA